MTKDINLGLFALLFSLMVSCQAPEATPGNEVTIIGAMQNVMWKGELAGNINLDTIANKEHLYGLGPVEYLAGELLIVDGHAYRSSVLTDSTMQVEATFAVKAPFFGYTNIEHWTEQDLPDDVQTIPQLEKYVDQLTQQAKRPFFFRLEGTIESAMIHIVNLPKGTKVSSPDEAHQGLTKYPLVNEEVDIIGFFSTEHKAILTHHDTFLHMHLITKDRQKMGHLDEVKLIPGTTKLYLPAE